MARKSASNKPSPLKGRKQSPAHAAKSRTANFRSGRRASVVSIEEGARAALNRIHPHATQIINAYAEAICQGRPGSVDPFTIAAMSEKAIMRLVATEQIREKGLTVEDTFHDKSGKVVGKRVKANPLFEHVRWMDEHLGLTVSDLQISRKSRGEGAKNEAETRELERRTRLATFMQENPKRLPPAPDITDSETVE